MVHEIPASPLASAGIVAARLVVTLVGANTCGCMCLRGAVRGRGCGGPPSCTCAMPVRAAAGGIGAVHALVGGSGWFGADVVWMGGCGGQVRKIFDLYN